jgi:hypothetical protein
MVLFGCDWCKAIKADDQTWILGLAAESIGVTSARREINIMTSWDESQACHPLAVHFCSVDHKDNYMAALFETDPLPVETVIKTKASGPRGSVEREYLRTASTGPIKTKKKRTGIKRRRAA